MRLAVLGLGPLHDVERLGDRPAVLVGRGLDVLVRDVLLAHLEVGVHATAGETHRWKPPAGARPACFHRGCRSDGDAADNAAWRGLANAGQARASIRSRPSRIRSRPNSNSPTSSPLPRSALRCWSMCSAMYGMSGGSVRRKPEASVSISSSVENGMFESQSV